MKCIVVESENTISIASASEAHVNQATNRGFKFYCYSNVVEARIAASAIAHLSDRDVVDYVKQNSTNRWTRNKGKYSVL
jgi:hypothetical protein